MKFEKEYMEESLTDGLLICGPCAEERLENEGDEGDDTKYDDDNDDECRSPGCTLRNPCFSCS